MENNAILLSHLLQNIVDFRESDLKMPGYSLHNLQSDLTAIYLAYLRLEDKELGVIHDNDGRISFFDVKDNVERNFQKLIKSPNDKTSFGGVSLLPSDELTDLVVAFENCIYVLGNMNKIAFEEEFFSCMQGGKSRDLLVIVSYIDQLSEMHK